MNEIVKYAAPNNQIVIEVGVEMETVWLNQRQMSELFEKDTDTIGLHLKYIFTEGELAESSTTEFFSVVQSEGKRKVNRKIKYYNLDAIISVGYRVNSIRGTQFRIWATKVLKEKLLESVNSKNAQLELAKVVKFIGRITEGKALEKEEAVGLLNLMIAPKSLITIPSWL